jgi:hypothetical protein
LVELIYNMSKKYQYFAKKRGSYLYEGARDIVVCRSLKSHFYTTNCYCCLNPYTKVGRTRRKQQTNDKQRIIDDGMREFNYTNTFKP